MPDAILAVVAAGPLVTFQDAGRPGHLRFGVPASGPMDRLAHAAANSAIGNPAGTTAIEVSLGGTVLECRSSSVTIAVTGGSFTVEVDFRPAPPWSVWTLEPGQRLVVRPGAWGSWAYVAVAGTLDVPRWLGSTATHTVSGYGGGVLTDGQEVTVKDARVDSNRAGEIPLPDHTHPSGLARVVMGPQDRHVEARGLAAFRDSAYTLTAAYDRMGVRLDGPPLPLHSSLSIPSEPIARGSIQVAGDGVPTVLLADHQTTGGYPKIATMISADLDRFVRHRPGDEIRFEAVSPSDAVVAARAADRADAEYLRTISGPGRTLEHRLRGENLIGGAVSTSDSASS